MCHLEAELIKDHANHDLRAVVALLFVRASFGFRVGPAQPLEMGVGQIVEQNRSRQIEQVPLALAQMLLNGVLAIQQQVTDAVKAIIARPSQLVAHQLRQSGASIPVQQTMLADWICQTVDNRDCCCLALAPVEPQYREQLRHAESLPVSARNRRIAQRCNRSVTRLARIVTVRLNELQHLPRPRHFQPEEHDASGYRNHFLPSRAPRHLWALHRNPHTKSLENSDRIRFNLSQLELALRKQG